MCTYETVYLFEIKSVYTVYILVSQSFIRKVVNTYHHTKRTFETFQSNLILLDTLSSCWKKMVENNILIQECQLGPYQDQDLFSLIGNRLFYFQTNRERKKEKKKFGRKKKVSSVFTQYVCFECVFVCVCSCVCLSVGALQTSSFNIGC